MKSAEIWNELGNTYFREGMFDKAIDAYDKSIEIDPRSGWAYSNLASVYAQLGKFSDAIPHYQLSLELFKSDKEKALTWRRLGNVYHLLQDNENAILAYKKADETSQPAAPLHINSAGPLEEGSGDSVDLPTGKVDTQPGYNNWQDDPALVYPLLEDGSKLENENTAVLIEQNIHRVDLIKRGTKDIKDPHILNELGNILVRAGAFDEAIVTFNKAIEIDPGYGWSLSNLGLLYSKMGKFVEAVIQFKRSLKLRNNNKEKAITWVRLGDTYRRLGHYDQALAAYQLADDLNKDEVQSKNEYRLVNIEFLVPNPYKKTVDLEIHNLVQSIRLYGIIQPLLVCPSKEAPGKYILIAGGRRLEAARQVGLSEIPVIVRRVSDKEILELSINENIHGEDVNPLELAEGYGRLVHEFDLSLEEVSVRVGKSQEFVANTLSILEYPEDVKKALDSKRINPEQARSLFTLSNQQSRDFAMQNILDNASNPGLADGSLSNIGDTRNKSYSKAGSPFFSGDRLADEDESYEASLPEDEIYHKKPSLLARARAILLGNPHADRKWASPSFRA